MAKDELDLVIYYKGDYYYVTKDEWQAARKLGQGEASVLGPLVSHGAIVAHNDLETPKYGNWIVTLVNMSALMGACKNSDNQQRQR
jgi:hypothetical protein